MSFAVSGIGGQNHIALGLVASPAGVDVAKLKMIGFAGSADSITAVIGGHVEGTAAPASLIAAQVATGRLRALGAGAEHRMSGPLADVPTWREQGIDAVVSNWRGIVGPKDMTAAQIAYWDDVFAKTVATAEWKQELERTQLEQHYLELQDRARLSRFRVRQDRRHHEEDLARERAARGRNRRESLTACGPPARFAAPDVGATAPRARVARASAATPGRSRKHAPLLPGSLRSPGLHTVATKYPIRRRSVLWRRRNEFGIERRRHIPCCSRPVAAAAAGGRLRDRLRHLELGGGDRRS